MLQDSLHDVPELRAERLVLRALRRSDAEDVFDYAKQLDVARHTLWDPHRSLQDTFAFLDFVDDQHRSGKAFVWGIVHKDEGRVVGTVGLANYAAQHSRAEMGFAIGQRYWGKGYTPEAVRVVLSFAFGAMELNRVEAYCKVENVASARVLEKTGFLFEGTLRQREFIKGRYEDLKLYAMVREDYFVQRGPDSSPV